MIDHPVFLCVSFVLYPKPNKMVVNLFVSLSTVIIPAAWSRAMHVL